MKVNKRILRWLTDNVALPIIRKYENDSPLIKHYEDEGGELQEVKDLLAVFGTQGHSGSSAPFIIHGFHNAVQFKILSPLKFTDDEFGLPLGISDESQQNKRLSSVFRYPNGVIKDIDAVTWFEETGVRYDMSKEAFIGCDYASKGYGFHSGLVVIYNDVDESCEYNDRFHIFGCEIDNKETFMGRHQVRIPTIEIYDSTDDKNDFFCHFARMNDIPNDFFIDYCLYWDNEKDEKFKECIDYCKKHHGKFCDVLQRKGCVTN